MKSWSKLSRVCCKPVLAYVLWYAETLVALLSWVKSCANPAAMPKPPAARVVATSAHRRPIRPASQVKAGPAGTQVPVASQMLLAIPLLMLYLVSIGVAYFFAQPRGQA